MRAHSIGRSNEWLYISANSPRRSERRGHSYGPLAKRLPPFLAHVLVAGWPPPRLAKATATTYTYLELGRTDREKVRVGRTAGCLLRSLASSSWLQQPVRT